MNRVRTVTALVACFNRKEKTLRCLKQLQTLLLPPDTRLDVVLVDDGSTDGTGEAVHAMFPAVKVIRGDGSLFWVGGMALAWNHVPSSDFYWCINDDVDFKTRALADLLDVHRNSGDEKTIVTGTMVDPDTGLPSYGGVRRHPWTMKFSVITPDPRLPLQADTANANSLLIPGLTVKQIGRFDTNYRHCFADFDYGLRAGKAGIRVLIAPGTQGACKDNPTQGSQRDLTLPLRERWKKMVAFKGVPPREWWRFVQAHGRFPKILFFIYPYLKLICTSALYPIKKTKIM